MTKASGPGEPPLPVVQAVKRLLRPLMRVLIAHGITFPVLSRLLKELYVEVAEAEFPVAGRPQTDSRITLLTGVHRKDVRAMREQGGVLDAPSAVISRNGQMIALWAGAPVYLDTSGDPRVLPKTGPVPSFESLVSSVSTDIRPRAILDEWLRLGLVTVDANGVRLNNAAFIPREDLGDLAYYFGRNLRDHIAASAHNLLGGAPAMLERAVYYEGLTIESIQELADLSRQIGSQALISVNQKAFELAQRDAADPAARHRLSFGVFFFSTPSESGKSKD